jgi:hypothetical protein
VLLPFVRKVAHSESKESKTVSDVREVLIRCTVTGKGMFPTEVTVVIPTADGDVSIYADKSLLHEEPNTALKATQLSVERDFAVCLLPIEDVDSRWVRIATHNVQDLRVA